MWFFRIFDATLRNNNQLYVKFKLSLICISLAISQIYCQNFIYPLFNNNYLKIDYLFHYDSSVHTSIKPYFIKQNSKQLTSYFSINQFRSDTLSSYALYPITYLQFNQHFQTYQRWGFFSGLCFRNKVSILFYPEFYLITSENILSKTMDSLGVIPSVGKYKSIHNQLYTTFVPTTTIRWQTFSFLAFDIGYGKHFIGEGKRSLFISDNASPFPYIKGTAKKWNVEYIVLYSFLNEPKWNNFSNKYTRKNSTLHYLSWNVNKRISIHAFETVIWQVHDSIGNRNFDINYINPIIFFRPVEFSLGSPDNVLMGAGFRLKLYKTTFLYSQFLLDEFKLSEWKSKTHWWGNKYGLQAGIKSFIPIRSNLLFSQIECNVVRPFTYAHDSYLRAWGHMHQSLAHPLGANFIEWLGQISYQHSNQWVFTLLGIYARQGQGSAYFNAGNNIYRSYNDHRTDYGNYLLIGNNSHQTILSFAIYRTILQKWQLQAMLKFDYMDISKENNGSQKRYLFNVGISTKGITFSPEPF
ncbi:MAG: hypothetical protein N2449_01105 [Bacteroidales bacterium]|nr:hypothetical protein [Bacteroidales bacterium]